MGRGRERGARWLTQTFPGYQVLREEFEAPLQMAASVKPSCAHILEDHT